MHGSHGLPSFKLSESGRGTVDSVTGPGDEARWGATWVSTIATVHVDAFNKYTRSA